MARRREEYRESREEERRPRERGSRYEKEYVSTNRQYEAGERGRMRGEEAGVAETKVEDWSEMKDSPIRQEGESTFRYRERKDRLMEEDARRIESTGLPQM